ncbi:MAG: hypothetical protein ACRC5C_11120, partial [Bacilli bacterium]
MRFLLKMLAVVCIYLVVSVVVILSVVQDEVWAPIWVLGAGVLVLFVAGFRIVPLLTRWLGGGWWAVVPAVLVLWLP